MNYEMSFDILNYTVTVHWLSILANFAVSFPLIVASFYAGAASARQPAASPLLGGQTPD